MYQSDMIRLAGGKNVAAEIKDTYWAEIDYEQLLTWDPTYIILASNAVYLYYFGVRSEKLLGTGKFLLLYLAAGICGGLCSVFLGDGYGVSIGASGAIYGLLGAMLLLTKKHGPRYTGMSYSTMLLLAATAICLGFFEPNVDNLGHIGGFLGGMAVFWLLLRR